ncbi:Predicted phosphohydrolase, Cof family, HAD superfamily [bacterium A37T11]|nr:Predicted phosphohydrolase, Cof family, HAD superfamily [bacterium A37T11]
MNEPKTLTAVAEFHHVFKHPVLEKPSIPDEKRCRLRVALLSEELKELEAAILSKDLTEIADALCDIQYVLSGAILEFGLGDKFKELFDEVQRSNMSKACKNIKEAEDTVAHYQAKGVDCFFEEQDGHFLVYRTEDHKTLKSLYYSPVDLQTILER